MSEDGTTPRTSAAEPAGPQDILSFWFEEISSRQWFRRSDAFDQTCRARFQTQHEAAARGDCDAWASTPRGCVALVLLLDQIPRNLYRDDGRAFATDGRAVAVTRSAIARGFDLDPALDDSHRQFLYMPLMHSEDLADQREALRVAERISRWDFAGFARRHCEIIERFGRFPHRNAALARPSTDDERLWLAEHGNPF